MLNRRERICVISV